MNVLTRIGVLCTLLGFGSLILEQLDMEFRIIAWAYDMQPTFGLVLGVAGLAMIAGAVMMGRRRAAKQAAAQSQVAQPDQIAQRGQVAQPDQIAQPGQGFQSLPQQPVAGSWQPPAPHRQR